MHDFNGHFIFQMTYFKRLLKEGEFGTLSSEDRKKCRKDMFEFTCKRWAELTEANQSSVDGQI